MTSRLRHDALFALVLSITLGSIWAWRDWANLTVLSLPDTDDVMRLQQVRDWIAGQHWFDLTQHRLAGGLPMHWTRLADLGPALLIAIVTPLIGDHAATVGAVIAWPLMLFAAALFLVARIATALGGSSLAGTATVVAAIAYPATTIFLPGRIDHHGLQLVLLLAATLGMLGRPCPQHRALAGLACAASLVVGLETAPLLAMLAAVALYDWIKADDADGERLAAFAVGAFAGLVIGRIGFAGTGWAYPACDGFTRDSWNAAMTLAAAPILLAGVTGTLTTPRRRLIATLVIGGAAASLALGRSPDCLSPYGRVDPFLARVWLAQVEEARSILTAGLARIIGYLGIMIAGIAATAWRLRRSPTRGWAMLFALQLTALMIAAVQLRGAYAGAMLAAPALAAAIGHARIRGTMRLAMAWVVSAGIVYPLAGQAVTPPHPASPSESGGSCTSPAMLAALARLPAGSVLAPIDAGPAILAQTRHSVLAAPYHRDTIGNRSIYAYYLGSDVADAPATYILACATMPIGGPRSVATRLAAGGAPGLQRLLMLPDGAAIFTPRLSKGPRSL